MRKPILCGRRKPPLLQVFLPMGDRGQGSRVYIPFIAPLKPPFKLDWSDTRQQPVNGVGRFD
jgi:hypothetical protein